MIPSADQTGVPEGYERIDAFERMAPTAVPGTGAIQSVTIHNGNIIAIRPDQDGNPRSWTLSSDGWQEIKP